MSLRKTSLSILVAIGAIISGYASQDVLAKPAFVHVRLSGQSSFICVNTGLSCTETGTTSCRVIIAALSRTTPGYVNSMCNAIPLSSPPNVGTYTRTDIVDADF